jgi:hypothetical protein
MLIHIYAGELGEINLNTLYQLCRPFECVHALCREVPFMSTEGEGGGGGDEEGLQLRVGGMLRSPMSSVQNEFILIYPNTNTKSSSSSSSGGGGGGGSTMVDDPTTTYDDPYQVIV